jgi:hypothetical protein
MSEKNEVKTVAVRVKIDNLFRTLHGLTYFQSEAVLSNGDVIPLEEEAHEAAALFDCGFCT